VTRIAAGLATGAAAAAATEAAEQAAAELDAASVDLAFLFLTPQYLEQAGEAASAVQSSLAPRRLLGCVAEGVIGREREVESGPAASVWAASLPGAQIEPFHVTAFADEDSVDLDGVPDLGEPALIALLVDPFTSPAGNLLGRLNEDYPGVPIVGGIATGGGQPGAQALLLDHRVYKRGTVGVGIAGVTVEAVVSQGCAPLGREAVITRAEGNVIQELAGRPALARLREIIAGLTPREQALASRGLLAGLVIDENKPEYGRSDFLMRGILGADEDSGAIAVGEEVRVGQTIRFHARDATSADQDLELALDETLSTLPAKPAGALLFTCNGRGTNMFDEPDHDSKALSAALRNSALAGFFCGGEIGPVGSRSFLHGFTATMAVFAAQDAGV
jgi:small ligand-binding sensory domain FIST